MVSAPGGRDRGQLMLVGAVTLAALLVGLVIVFNSALFTETVDQESAIQSSNTAIEYMTQTERDLRALAVRVNHARMYGSDAAVDAAIRENVTRYNRVTKEAYADGSATYVNVTYHPADSTDGRRIVQGDDEQFTAPSGSDDWSPVQSQSRVGWLVLNLNTSELSFLEEFSVRLTNSSGAFYEASFTRNSTGSVVVRENVSSNHAANGTTTCRPVNGRLLVDVQTGEVYSRDCSFNGSSTVDGPYEVRFGNGDAAVGEYEIVTRDGAAVHSSLTHCGASPPSSPCHVPVAWGVNVTMDYRGPQAEFRKNVTVEVYDGGG